MSNICRGLGGYSGAVGDSPETELIHLTCPSCGQITSLSLASVMAERKLPCPYCGEKIPVDAEAAREEGRREALELDQSPDSLGSVE